MALQLPSAFRFLWATTADDGNPVRYRMAHGGRGSAKSHSFCRALLLKSAERALRIGCYREVQKSIRDSVKRLLDDTIRAMVEDGDIPKGFFASTDTEIRSALGGLFIFSGLKSNPDAVKSTEGLDLAVVFEANKVSQTSWDLLIPTVRQPRSEIWGEWNPEDPADPVDAMFRGKDGPPPGSIVREINWRQNPWFPDVLRSDMEFDARRDADKHAWVWLGAYRKNSEARVFRNWRVETFDTPPDAILRFGADWGFAVDPTVLIRCFIGRWEDGEPVADLNGRVLFIDHEAYKVGCEIDETPALFAGDCPADYKTSDGRPLWENAHEHPGVPGALKWLITADSARPETVSYMKRRRFRIASAIKGKGSIEDGVEFLKSYDIVVHTRCRHSQDELTSYSWKVDPDTGEILPLLADKDNNLIDAGRYACEGVRRARKPSAPAQAETADSGYRRRDQPRGGQAWKSG